MENRRKFPRLAVDVDVCWQKVEGRESADNPSKDITKNISEGGICLMVYEPLVKGETISLEFTLPTGKRINATGRVAWTSTFEVISEKAEASRCDAGIEFIDISKEDKLEIQKFVFSFLKR